MVKKNIKKQKDSSETNNDHNDKIKASGTNAYKWEMGSKPIKGTFDGSSQDNSLVRVSVDKEAYALICFQSKDNLDIEIGGVLIGSFCEDDRGVFLKIDNIIKAKTTQQTKTQITFTQETWNDIHSEKDRLYPKKQIVGWYHSHPGFGVEFSEMDMFIQKNFFTAIAQIALVIDPLGGQTAIIANTPDGLKHISSFWINGREHKCVSPASNSIVTQTGDLADISERINNNLTNISKLTQSFNDLRKTMYNFYFTISMLLCICFAAYIGWSIYSAMNSKYEPPSLTSYIPVPIQVGDETIMVGLGVVNWVVPEEMKAKLLESSKEFDESNSNNADNINNNSSESKN